MTHADRTRLGDEIAELERLCRGYRRATLALGRPEDEDDVRWLREGETGMGFVRFDIQVRTEEAALLRRALEVAISRARAADVPAGTRAGICRRADALLAIAESYLSGSDDAAPPVELVVHVDADATLDDGTVLPDATGERLACDATIVVVPWSQGGPTSLANLVSLCRRHHTYVHEYGMRIVAGDDAQLRFVRRDGSEMPPCDARPEVASDPVAALRARNDAAIDATTSYRSGTVGRPTTATSCGR